MDKNMYIITCSSHTLQKKKHTRMHRQQKGITIVIVNCVLMMMIERMMKFKIVAMILLMNIL